MWKGTCKPPEDILIEFDDFFFFKVPLTKQPQLQAESFEGSKYSPVSSLLCVLGKTQLLKGEE